MFSSRSVQIAAVFSDVFGQALPNLCRSFYNETKAEMFFSVFAVALLAEGVDRNWMRWTSTPEPAVALLAEGVDRNIADQNEALEVVESPSSRRAWIEIGGACRRPVLQNRSPSSRRAWIEIGIRPMRSYGVYVALLAEGVDRNWSGGLKLAPAPTSPSSRRAWIEMCCG